MLKIAQLADLHIGYKSTRLVNAQGINLREADGYLVFSKIVSEVIEEEVDAVIVCGDTFHTPTPEIRAIIFVQNQLRRLWSAGIKVYMLAGNHDTNDIKADIAASRVLHDPWRKIYSHAEPYVKHEIMEGVNVHLISHHMFGEQSETMSNIKPVDNEINILSTHGSIFDSYLHEVLHAEQSPREIVIPQELVTDYNWDYSMFGHIHERGWVGSSDKKTDTAESKIYYNGSTIRRGFSDKEMPLGRGWTLWNVDSSGKFTATPKTIAQRPQYDFEEIDATNFTASEITDQIIANLKETQTDGLNFNSKNAPLLRQRLLNISPAKYAALDLKNISRNASHAMSWGIKSKTIHEAFNKTTDDDGNTIRTSDNADVVKGYDDWIETAPSLKDLKEVMKEKVVTQAREYVKLGQEETLDADQ